MPQQIRAHELAAKISGGDPIYLLDVRQPWEHEIAALPGSHLIPLQHLQARAGELHPAENSMVIAYCHHGIRSLSAAYLLENLGFREVFSLSGGIDSWSLEVDPNVPRY